MIRTLLDLTSFYSLKYPNDSVDLQWRYKRKIKSIDKEITGLTQ